MRDEKEQIRESILNEVWTRYETANEDGILDQRFIRNDNQLKDRKTGDILLYTKGFKPSDNQKKATLKGASNIDLAVIEEAEDIRDVDKYNTFVDSLRKEGCLIVIMLNVPDVNHWIVKRWFNTELVETDQENGSYFKLIPKDIPGFFCIQSTFEDNPFLPPHIISNYKGYGDPESHLYNPHYYFTAIKGYASLGRKGQIFKHAKSIKLSDYLKLPFREFFGQDFGTSKPAALCGAKLDGNNIYARQLSYKPMDILEIGKLYCRLRLTKNDKVIADHADPSWKKLKDGFKDLTAQEYMEFPQLASGFHVVPCEKGPGSLEFSLSLLLSMNIFIVEESTDFWDEQRQYVWDTDKNGNLTDQPIDDFNHLWDGLRYIAVDQRGKKELFGI
jgi:phage terminase large subunit